MKSVNGFSNPNFLLRVRKYHLEKALMLQRFLQSKPSKCLPTANMIANPGKRFRHDSPTCNTKSHRIETFVKLNGSYMMPLIFTHETNPGGRIHEHTSDIRGRCHHDLPRR